MKVWAGGRNVGVVLKVGVNAEEMNVASSEVTKTGFPACPGVRGAERAGDRQKPGAAVEGDGSMDQV